MSRAMAAIATSLVVCAARAGDAPALTKDPFVRPQLIELAQPVAAIAPPPLELRAVLSAGDTSLANVGGRILRVGEEIDGYRLVAVSEGGARFARDGRSIEVPLQARAPAPAPVLATDAAVGEEGGDAN